jgi:nickel-dependent lactate racemase
MNGAGSTDARLDEATVRSLCAAEVSRWQLQGRRVLAIVPDETRSAPLDVVFPILHDLIAGQAAAFDVLVALGTHPPISDQAINRRLGIQPSEREGKYRNTRFMNHRWSDPGQLVSIGKLTEDDVEALSEGRLRESVDITINKLALEYDLLLIIGPTFPHEVVGFSGGNKYLFPGISGKEIIDSFHWLGALITNAEIIGTKHTPVRAIIDRAASMLQAERKCVSLVVDDRGLAGLFLGSPEEAWSAAADLSGRINVRYEDRTYESVLSCAPEMYRDLWVGGKCVYKLEPVVADGGELIIYAPHITQVSVTHGEAIRRIGYHVRDYFVNQMHRFPDIPRGVIAHSTHVRGAGTYEGGVEKPRFRVTLATGIPEEECRAIGLGYRDVRDIDVATWRDGRSEGRLYVPKAGETLFRLRRPAAHASTKLAEVGVPADGPHD